MKVILMIYKCWTFCNFELINFVPNLTFDYFQGLIFCVCLRKGYLLVLGINYNYIFLASKHKEFNNFRMVTKLAVFRIHPSHSL